MKKDMLMLGKLGVLLFLVFFVMGPSLSHAQRGGVINQDQRIPLAESGKGKWAGREASVDYEYRRGPGGVTISGVVNFADLIAYNYVRITYFQAEIIFGDSQGRVLSSRGLMSTRQSHFDPVKFTMQIPMPPGAALFAFSYRGEVVDSSGGRGHGGANPTYIWAYPIKR